MKKINSILYGAVLLTASNLLLHFVSMGFQIYLSGRIGAAGIGLLHLILSVKGLSFTLGAAGIRGCSTYLSAEEIGRGKSHSIRGVISGCFHYSLLFSVPVSICLWRFAPRIAAFWIGDTAAVSSLRLYSLCLSVNCLEGVISGCFISFGRIKELVGVNFTRQCISILCTFFLLSQREAGSEWSCLSVMAGDCVSSLIAFIILFIIYRKSLPPYSAKRLPPYRRILKAALPLGIIDDLRSGLRSAKNLIIPKQLALYAGTLDAMADYGVVCGMVFPLLMFPAEILFSMSELLMPEFSRCAAGENYVRVRYLAKRSLRVSLLFSLVVMGLYFCGGEALGNLLYQNSAVGTYLKLYAPLVPMLYIDNVVDAVCKGLGQQNANARYNMITAFLEVSFLWFLLPRMGLRGFYISYTVTHLVNFLLSFRRLIISSGISPDIRFALRALFSSSAAVFIISFLPEGEGLWGFLLPGTYYFFVLTLLWILFRVISGEDLSWLCGLISPKNPSVKEIHSKKW